MHFHNNLDLAKWLDFKRLLLNHSYNTFRDRQSDSRNFAAGEKA